MGTLPTVKIADPDKPGDYAIINEADFDPKAHVRWTGAFASVAEADAHFTDIPADWRTMRYFALRALAQKLTPEPVNDKKAAVAVIEAEEARRGH